MTGYTAQDLRELSGVHVLVERSAAIVLLHDFGDVDGVYLTPVESPHHIVVDVPDDGLLAGPTVGRDDSQQDGLVCYSYFGIRVLTFVAKRMISSPAAFLKI